VDVERSTRRRALAEAIATAVDAELAELDCTFSTGPSPSASPLGVLVAVRCGRDRYTVGVTFRRGLAAQVARASGHRDAAGEVDAIEQVARNAVAAGVAAVSQYTAEVGAAMLIYGWASAADPAHSDEVECGRGAARIQVVQR
jgi:hypothetical protein